MKEIILTGFITGITISLSFGAVFFSLLQINMRYGISAGFTFSTGVLFSDLLIALLLYFGLSQLTIYNSLQHVITLAGGIFLILFGIRIIFQKTMYLRSDTINTYSRTKQLSFLGKGFILNNTNPGVWIFWIGITGLATIYRQNGSEYPWIMLLICSFTIYICDLIKSMLTTMLSKKLTPHILRSINLIAGLFIFCTGLILLIKGF